MLISDAQAAYLVYLEYRKRATKTSLVTYKSRLREFLRYTGDKDISELTLADVDAYADALTLQNLKPKTYRNKLCIVRSFYKYLYAKNLTNVRPESIDLPPETQEEMTYLTPVEQHMILSASASNLRDHAMLQVLLSSGLRVSELCNLKTTDIFRRSISVKNGKGRKHRVTFINKQAEEALRLYRNTLPDREGYLFPNPAGSRLSRVIVARKVRFYSDKAGIRKHVSPHTMRHTFATSYLDKGGRIEDLQQMLGHADMKTTMLYLHFTNERLHNSYDTIM